MTDKADNNLTNQKLQQILRAVGSHPAKQDTEQAEATDYDWHRSHYFTNAQIEKIAHFMENTARTMAEKFTNLYRSEFKTAIISTTQHIAAELLPEISEKEKNNYYLTFSIEHHQAAKAQNNNHPQLPCGVISISPQTVSTWIAQLFGEKEPEQDSNRPLSQLEQSLLLDMLTGLIEAFSDSYDNHDVCPLGSIVREQMPLELQPTEELCKIVFSLGKTESESNAEAYLLILCDNIEPLVNENAKADKKFSYKDISNAITRRMQQFSVTVNAQLASTTLAFEELINLQPGDIVLFDKKINDEIKLTVQNRPILYGRPAKSMGNYAVAITRQAPVNGNEI